MEPSLCSVAITAMSGWVCSQAGVEALRVRLKLALFPLVLFLLPTWGLSPKEGRSCKWSLHPHRGLTCCLRGHLWFFSLLWLPQT